MLARLALRKERSLTPVPPPRYRQKSVTRSEKRFPIEKTPESEVVQAVRSSKSEYSYPVRKIRAKNLLPQKSLDESSFASSHKYQEHYQYLSHYKSRLKLKSSPPPEETTIDYEKINHRDHLYDPDLFSTKCKVSVLNSKNQPSCHTGIVESGGVIQRESDKSTVVNFVKQKQDSSSLKRYVEESQYQNKQKLIKKQALPVARSPGNSGQVSSNKKKNKMNTITIPRLRKGLVMGMAGMLVVLTMLVLMDLQLDLGYSGHHLVPSHGRIKMGDAPGRDSVYNNFRRKFLQRTSINGSKESSGSPEQTLTQTNSAIQQSKKLIEEHDNFIDLVKYTEKSDGVSVDEGVVRISGENLNDNPSIGELKHLKSRLVLSNFKS